MVDASRDLDSNLVSVITPVYNSERFIAETICAVQAQTHAHWEMLILIDKGTKDRTAEIVREFSAKDPRVKLIEVREGRSVSEARNHGFKISRGRFIAFLDADDLWLPTKIEKQLRAMRESGAALSYTGFRRFSLDGSQVGREIRVPAQATYSDLLKVNFIGCLTAVVDQEKTGPLHMGTDQHEDFTLWLKILKSGQTACGVCEDLARYRIVPGSRSSRKALMANWRWHVYRDQEGLSVLRSLYFYFWYVILTGFKHLRF